MASTHKPCDICRDSGVVRLPTYRPVAPETSPDIPNIDESSRTYPCPQCAPNISSDRLKIITASGIVRYPDEGEQAKDYAREAIANIIAHHLLREDMIRFETKNTSASFPFGPGYSIIGTVGVVAPATVATFEQRVAESGKRLAAEVAQEAIAQIDNWESASRYHDHRIYKSDASRFIMEALRTVTNKKESP